MAASEQHRRHRFVDEDASGLILLQEPETYSPFSVSNILNQQMDDCIKLLNEEQVKHDMLRSAMENALKFAKSRKMSEDPMTLVQIAYTLEDPPFYVTFNEETRKLRSSFDWYKFPYKGFWLCLFHIFRDADTSLSGDCYRVVGAPMEAHPGQNVFFKQFTSSSQNLAKAMNFIQESRKSTVFVINNASGLDLNEISIFPDEQEILFRPNDLFDVVSIEKKSSGLRVIRLEQKNISGIF